MKIRNYWYLATGLLFVLFAVSHTWNGLVNVLPISGNSTLGTGVQADLTYLWHMIGLENLALGIILIALSLLEKAEKARFAAWTIAAILFARWTALTLTTLLTDINNAAILLVDTVAMFTLIALLIRGSRANRTFQE